MKQNLVSLTFTPDQLEAADAALARLEEIFAPLLSLDAEQVRSLFKMGDKSEVFCRSVLQVLAQNPQIVTPALGLPEAQADLAALDALRPRLRRLRALSSRAEDTCTALGADVMAAALEGYALTKVAGYANSLDEDARALGTRFSKRRRDKGTAALAPA